MPNSATINISSPSGSHRVILQQNANYARTIESSLDGAPHELTDCSANKAGTSFKGNTTIHAFLFAVFHDTVTVDVDPDANAVTMTISGYGTFTGVLGPGEAAALVAFVKAANLPDLAA